MSLQSFDKKQTKWEGLWFHKEYNGFSSAAFDMSVLKDFKGKVRLYVRKNKYFNNGENGRPNYCFCIKDSDSDVFYLAEVEDEPEFYKDKDGNRLFTYDEVRQIINGTVEDVKFGITDPYDILPEDFV